MQLILQVGARRRNFEVSHSHPSIGKNQHVPQTRLNLNILDLIPHEQESGSCKLVYFLNTPVVDMFHSSS
jgi:hypothetical protein